MTHVTTIRVQPGRRSAHISWDPPIVPIGPGPYAYEITLDGGITWRNTGTIDPFWTASDLQLGSRLRVAVRGLYIFGRGPDSEVVEAVLPTTRIEASTALLIGQWREAENLQTVIDIIIAAFRDRIESPHQRLREMTLIDQAEGVWLDYLAARVGLRRPYITGSLIGASDERFGFDSAGVGFDQRPFRGEAAHDAYFPMPDPIMRRMIRARAVLLLGHGDFGSFQAALAYIDESATARDNRDMSVTVVTDTRWIVETADRIGALPRPAGVRLILRDRGRFGFDEAGVGFDLGPYA